MQAYKCLKRVVPHSYNGMNPILMNPILKLVLAFGWLEVLPSGLHLPVLFFKCSQPWCYSFKKLLGIYFLESDYVITERECFPTIWCADLLWLSMTYGCWLCETLLWPVSVFVIEPPIFLLLLESYLEIIFLWVALYKLFKEIVFQWFWCAESNFRV